MLDGVSPTRAPARERSVGRARPRIADRVASTSWDGVDGDPDVSVLIATYGRARLLPELVEALEAQVPGDEVTFEVVIVDDASPDDTWATLSEAVRATPLRMLALRLGENRGPATARQIAFEHSRGAVLAVTDDDCVPSPTWLGEIHRELLERGSLLTQGRTCPAPEDVGSVGPWDHTMWVTTPTPWFETCNIAYRREAFERVGGFDTENTSLNPGGGSHFGEDVDLAARILTHGRAAFADTAVVHHRVEPGTYRQWLRSRRRLAGFPLLAKRSPIVAASLYQGVFLDRSTARFDVALVGLAAAVLTRRPAPALLALPWTADRWRAARRFTPPGPATVVLAAQLAVGDVVSLASLVKGSVRHRRAVL